MQRARYYVIFMIQKQVAMRLRGMLRLFIVSEQLLSYARLKHHRQFRLDASYTLLTALSRKPMLIQWGLSRVGGS